MEQTKLILTINLQFFAGEKTEEATPKKKQDAREKGQVAKSQEVASALIMLACFLFLLFMGQSMGANLTKMMRGTFTEYLHWDVTVHNVQVVFNQLLLESALIVVPFLLIALVMGVFSNYIQIGFLFTTEPLKMKLEKLDPIQGAKKIFSMRSIVELLKSILKIILTSTIAILVLSKAVDEIMVLSQTSVGHVLTLVSSLTVQIGTFIALLLLVLSVLDYIYQKYEHEKGLRMSKQDVKDEYKKTEGDPLIKGKIKQRQREMAMSRMMQEIPKADVVITNPTHFAVAIQYNPSEMQAPKVIAKGKDLIALRIKEIAQRENIITMENKPLARALHAQVEIGQEVPESLFKAVAEVLAYVYQLRKRA
ncbi:flagellar biosynthesis protein FlhB [Ammoniphilus sp. CFH 90114]|uniref:flagellar biosynthesis protein FlhB n=1 Tax=Ammoniphilus sp. CFH 90114 TaxID=2493665 RepID=UPI00100F5188|nr:flagellar biosynthesis protein FlhB [Ammoniphilus sp. CFH 90114]RXT15129.1 flagellar biosynthesis protein FlhB [Ammoniphilus sp. CFH 90114]